MNDIQLELSRAIIGGMRNCIGHLIESSRLYGRPSTIENSRVPYDCSAGRVWCSIVSPRSGMRRLPILVAKLTTRSGDVVEASHEVQNSMGWLGGRLDKLLAEFAINSIDNEFKEACLLAEEAELMEATKATTQIDNKGWL